MTAPTLTVAALFASAQGAPGAFNKETVPGTTVTGRILTLDVRQRTDLDGKPQTWEDGNPQQQIVIGFQAQPAVGDDDGQRRLYIKWWGDDKAAALAATHAVGAPHFELGGIITARYDGEGEQTKKGFNPPKMYSYAYERPNAAAALMAQTTTTARSASPLLPGGVVTAPASAPLTIVKPAAEPVAATAAPAPALVVDGQDSRVLTIKTLIGHGLSDIDIDRIVPGFGPEAIAAVRGLL